MALLRGRGQGLEIVLTGRDFGEALDELDARLAERSGFYRGCSAVAAMGANPPEAQAFARLRRLLNDAGIELRALSGGPAIEGLAREAGVAFEPAIPVAGAHELERRRALRPRRDAELSDAARSLVADFAGARADIASRRKRGEASVRRLDPPAPPSAKESPAPGLHVVGGPAPTLYHAGTLRGGQTLHHDGNIVVVGDVNPGAELIATGDVLVFGRLAGVAHAGAQGNADARVYALALDATQLRIATFIATDTDDAVRSPGSARAEAALVRDGRIAIVAFDRLGKIEPGAASS